jgi:predicted CXXCH cytochrome family protein
MLRLAALTAVVISLAASLTATADDGCADCHRDLVAKQGADVHATAGLGCATCHRGNASAKTEAAAHAGFVARPKGWAVATLCGGCHGDIEGMRTLNPRLPTDQLAQYRTSHHGKLAQKGDARVATCVSCHGHHGIKHVKDPASTASKERIVETCTGCHNATYMQGRDVPTDQLEKYKASVHGHKRLVERDAGAPACNDCHGNHGAAPPGAGAVVNVCGTCHAVFAERFATSPHKDVFERGCIECHDNHRILAPSDAMLGDGPEALCATCHADDAGAKAASSMHGQLTALQAAIERAATQLGQVRNAGLEVGEDELRLREARNHLVLTRTEVHTFHEAPVAKVAGEGLALAARVEGAAQQGFRELAFRRRGLALSMIAILFVVVALVLKIRALERPRRSG